MVHAVPLRAGLAPRFSVLFAFSLLPLLLSACATPHASRVAARMADPGATPMRSLACRQRLLSMGPVADAYRAEAFFPIGLYDVPEAALPEIAAAGFNLIVNSDTIPSYQASAEAAGLRLIPYIRREKESEDVAEARDSKSIFAWYLMDEPELNGVSPVEYAGMAEKLHRLDPSRPIFLTLLRLASTGEYGAGADILAPTPHPIRNMTPARNDLRMMGRMVDAARAGGGGKPVWAVVQAFFAEPYWPRNPTPVELRAMVFIALNHGADGIVYFSYNSGDQPITLQTELFDAIRRTNGQLSALRGALLCPPEVVAQKQISQDTPPDTMFAPPPVTEDPIDCSIRRFAGARLFIAVNPDAWAREVEFALPNADADRTVTELFSPKAPAAPLARQSATLRLAFQPYDVRIFWIR